MKKNTIFAPVEKTPAELMELLKKAVKEAALREFCAMEDDSKEGISVVGYMNFQWDEFQKKHGLVKETPVKETA